MREMLALIERNTPGNEIWWRKILNAVPVSDLNESGFSEYETFSHFLLAFHPELVEQRKLVTFRYGRYLVTHREDYSMIPWIAKNYQIISFENHYPPAYGASARFFLILRKIGVSSRYFILFYRILSRCSKLAFGD